MSTVFQKSTKILFQQKELIKSVRCFWEVKWDGMKSILSSYQSRHYFHFKGNFTRKPICKQYFYFFLFWPHCTAYGILVPRAGIEPRPRAEHRALTTGPPGSPWCAFPEWLTPSPFHLHVSSGEVSACVFVHCRHRVLVVWACQGCPDKARKAKWPNILEMDCLEVLETRGPRSKAPGEDLLQALLSFWNPQEPLSM